MAPSRRRAREHRPRTCGAAVVAEAAHAASMATHPTQPSFANSAVYHARAAVAFTALPAGMPTRGEPSPQARGSPWWDVGRAEDHVQRDLAYDIFGNPFRLRPPLDPSVLGWNGRTIPKMAQGIYEERAFERLPILADALEEAACTDADSLAHCRGTGPHARGCWRIDLLLGKKPRRQRPRASSCLNNPA